MLLLQSPKGQRKNNVSGIEIYHVLGLPIIDQSFPRSHFARVGNLCGRNAGKSVIKENVSLYLSIKG